MRINPVNVNYDGQIINKRPSFKAVLLKDNLLFVDKITHSPIEGAIVELETETRELIADARRKHEHDISKEEYEKRMNVWSDRISTMDFLSRNKINHERDIYLGDYKLMDELAKYSSLQYTKEINERVKANDMYNSDLSEMNYISMRTYWNAITNGRSKLSPEGFEGLLDKDLYNYLSRTDECRIDSIIPGTAIESYISAPRQRVLLAVEHQKDGNYRNLPDSKVYGIAEISTDRAMDVIEEMAADKIAAEEEKNGHKFISYKAIGKEMMEMAKIPENRINPVEIHLLDAFGYLKGVKNALLDAACEKGKYCGIVAKLGNIGEYYQLLANGFKNISGIHGIRFFKPGFLQNKLKIH